MRSANARAVGITRKAVIAATGQAIAKALAHWRRKCGSKPTASQVAINVTSATITIVINAAVSARTRQSIMPLPLKRAM
jgi:hypothetical protein